MRHVFQLCVIAMTLTGAAFGQDLWFTSSTGVVSLAGAGATATIQRGSGTSSTIQLHEATVYCSVACTITQSQNGTAASSTAGSIRGLNPNSYAAATATFWTVSNVGAGTSIGAPVTCTAACTIVLDLSRIQFPKGSTNYNYSITISSITGDYSIGFMHKEKQ
jgi:hypothetical protein